MATKSIKVDELTSAMEDNNIQDITMELRNLIFEASGHVDITEEVKWGMPSYSYKGNFCYLQPAKNHVNLGFYLGASLQDADKLLEGNGKQMRHIRIRKVEDIQVEKFVALINEALFLNEKN